MIITFNSKLLEQCASDDRYCSRKLGILAKPFRQRLDDLWAAKTLEDARSLPGKYHELRENRKGQWACSLSGNCRLIFRPHENPIPTNDDGQYIWSEIHGIEIIEIEDYHK